ncbi:MAG: phosphoglycerate kinase [Lentisphaerae bacterium]|nr:phosphoglycerate kinase [Lentisphaerota bacterium]
MIGKIKTLDDIDPAGRTVLLRVDINCPVDGATKRITDDTRIRRSAGTLRELSDAGAKTVILAHQADPLDYRNFTLLEEHRERLAGILGRPVDYISDVVGPAALERVRELQPGGLLLLENVRIHTEETVIFEKEARLSPAEQAQTLVVRRLAPLADLYVCDAFACVHRSEPTLVGFPRLLPAAAGRLFEAELRALTAVRDNPAHPCVFVLGGAKILDAFGMMRSVLENGSADAVLTTGLVAPVMMKAAGADLGAPTDALLEKMNLLPFVAEAQALLEVYADRIVRPVDVGLDRNGTREDVPAAALPADGMIADIGPETRAAYAARIAEAKTIFMNGPAGRYEDPAFAAGTEGLWNAVADSAGMSVMGGGDSIAAAERFKVAGRISYISTAGGGLIRFLSGRPLPVLEALEQA